MSKPAASKDDTKKHLETLLSEKAKAAAQSALASDGVPADQEINSLRNLARLVRILQLGQPAAPRRRWPLPLMLGATLSIVSFLLFLHVRNTEIELDASLSEVSFVLLQEQALNNSFELSSLGVSGVKVVQLPSLSKRDLSDSLTSGDEDKAVRLATISSGKQLPGSISFATMIVPAGSRVGLRRGNTTRDYRLSVQPPQGSQLELRADVTGTIEVSTSNAPSEVLTLVSPKAFVFSLAAPEVDLDLTLRDDGPNPLASNLTIKDPSFLTFEEIVDAERTLNRQVPTILSGTLYYQELYGQERTLRGSEGLQLTNCQGELRTIEMASNGLRFRFIGQASGIDKGLGPYKANLMPTYLEWIKANHGLTLLWGTTLYIFGLALGVLRWWGWL